MKSDSIIVYYTTVMNFKSNNVNLNKRFKTSNITHNVVIQDASYTYLLHNQQIFRIEAELALWTLTENVRYIKYPD